MGSLLLDNPTEWGLKKVQTQSPRVPLPLNCLLLEEGDGLSAAPHQGSTLLFQHGHLLRAALMVPGAAVGALDSVPGNSGLSGALTTQSLAPPGVCSWPQRMAGSKALVSSMTQLARCIPN